MRTRTRISTEEQDLSLDFQSDEGLDLESLSEEELEELLFDEEPVQSKGMFNLPTIAGLSLILVGVGYIFQKLGLWNGLDLSVLAGMLPWLAGILIILLGFGVLSWRPERKKKKKNVKVKQAARTQDGKKVAFEVETKASSTTDGKRRLAKSRDKKLAGVCAGIAEYFNIDPTLVRIAFVIGTIASGGPFLLAYVLLSFIMPNPEKPSLEERITIIRDS